MKRSPVNSFVDAYEDELRHGQSIQRQRRFDPPAPSLSSSSGIASLHHHHHHNHQHQHLHQFQAPQRDSHPRSGPPSAPREVSEVDLKLLLLWFWARLLLPVLAKISSLEREIIDWAVAKMFMGQTFQDSYEEKLNAMDVKTRQLEYTISQLEASQRLYIESLSPVSAQSPTFDPLEVSRLLHSGSTTAVSTTPVTAASGTFSRKRSIDAVIDSSSVTMQRDAKEFVPFPFNLQGRRSNDRSPTSLSAPPSDQQAPASSLLPPVAVDGLQSSSPIGLGLSPKPKVTPRSPKSPRSGTKTVAAGLQEPVALSKRGGLETITEKGESYANTPTLAPQAVSDDILDPSDPLYENGYSMDQGGFLKPPELVHPAPKSPRRASIIRSAEQHEGTPESEEDETNFFSLHGFPFSSSIKSVITRKLLKEVTSETDESAVSGDGLIEAFGYESKIELVSPENGGNLSSDGTRCRVCSPLGANPGLSAPQALHHTDRSRKPDPQSSTPELTVTLRALIDEPSLTELRKSIRCLQRIISFELAQYIQPYVTPEMFATWNVIFKYLMWETFVKRKSELGWLLFSWSLFPLRVFKMLALELPVGIIRLQMELLLFFPILLFNWLLATQFAAKGSGIAARRSPAFLERISRFGLYRRPANSNSVTYNG